MLKPISDDCLDVEGKNIAEVDHSSLFQALTGDTEVDNELRIHNLR